MGGSFLNLRLGVALRSLGKVGDRTPILDLTRSGPILPLHGAWGEANLE